MPRRYYSIPLPHLVVQGSSSAKAKPTKATIMDKCIKPKIQIHYLCMVKAALLQQSHDLVLYALLND